MNWKIEKLNDQAQIFDQYVAIYMNKTYLCKHFVIKTVDANVRFHVSIYACSFLYL